MYKLPIIMKNFLVYTAVINFQCNSTLIPAMMGFSYSCEVTLSDGDLDTLVCTLDGVPREPCALTVLIKHTFSTSSR